MRIPIKTCMLLLILAITLTQCKKSTVNQIDLLPPITTNGANTFGCLINGTAVIPRDGQVSLGNPYASKGANLLFDLNDDIMDISFSNGDNNLTPSTFFLLFHFANFSTLHIGVYNWRETQYGTSAFPYYLNNAYGSIYNPSINNVGWFGSYDSSGMVTITKFDTTNHIIAATFNGKFREKNGTKELPITDGRFDINWITVANKNFL